MYLIVSTLLKYGFLIDEKIWTTKDKKSEGQFLKIARLAFVILEISFNTGNVILKVSTIIL